MSSLSFVQTTVRLTEEEGKCPWLGTGRKVQGLVEDNCRTRKLKENQISRQTQG